jgi:hypothetical protein
MFLELKFNMCLFQIMHFEEMNLSVGECLVIIRGTTSDYNGDLGIKIAPFSQLVRASDFMQLLPKIKKYEDLDSTDNIELKDYILKNIKKERKEKNNKKK